MNLLVIHDDSAFHTKHSLASLRKKRVKLADMPSMIDAKTVVLFLLLKAYFVVVRNPSKSDYTVKSRSSKIVVYRIIVAFTEKSLGTSHDHERKVIELA